MSDQWVPGGMPIFEVRNQEDRDVLEEVWVADVYRVMPGDFEGRSVLDIGAHIGAFSVYAAHHGAKAVVSVEPQVANWGLLCRNLEPYRPTVDLTTLNVAAGVSRGLMTVVGTGGGGFAVPADPLTKATEVVDALTLSDLLEIAGGEVGVLKLDCEGWEWDLLLSTPPAALSRVRLITGEWHGQEITDRSVDESQLGEALTHLLATHGVEIFGHPWRGGQFVARNYNQDSL